MAKVKYTSGVLCRDKGGAGFIGFFAELLRDGAWKGDSGFWWGLGWAARPQYSWTLAEWKATYDLAPPRKGQAFECEVQL